MKTNQNQTIPSVNFHLWEPCNFKCKFCFATFQDVRKTILPKGHLPKNKALEIIDLIALSGFKKITFVGGEPTLCPWLGDLIVQAKVKGLTTMVVTNGTGISEKFLNDVNGFLDWVVLSIDSIESNTNKIIGRSSGNRFTPDKEFYKEKACLIHKYNIRLKVNTVINKFNYTDQSITEFVMSLNPKRWKILKALKVKGQNDESFNQVETSEEEFKLFLHLNKIYNNPIAISENNEEMTGTYIMIDPAGRFFDNTLGEHTYSQPILEVGIEAALNQINFDYLGFLERGGLYEW